MLRSHLKNARAPLLNLIGIAMLASCAARPAATPSEADSAAAETKAEVSLPQRIKELEAQVVQLNEKLTQTQTSFENLMLIQKSKTVAVSPGPTDQRGVSVREQALSQTKNDPDRGFVQDGSTKRYRTAKIFFESGKWSDSILEFSQFLREYPDHLLAGSAQYHIGVSYQRQGETKLALDEFERVLLAYERSPHVTDTLHAMAEAQEKLHQTEAAQNTRQQLISLFPLSPAARDLVYSKPTTTPTAPLPAHAEEAP